LYTAPHLIYKKNIP